MNAEFKVDYLLDEESDTIRVKSISLSPGGFLEVASPDGSKAIYLKNGVLYYTFTVRSFSSRKFSVEVLRIDKVYKRGSFRARSRFIKGLLKKWSLSPKEVEIPIKTSKAKVKLRCSSPGIQVDVIQVPLSNSYLVTRVQALPQEKLPPIYTDEEPEYTLPRVWQDGDTLVANNHHVLLCTGNTYSYGELKKALLYIELAGRHLTVANQHIKPLQAKWAKSNVITFRDGCPLKATTFQKRKEVDWGSLYSCFRSCSIC